MSTRFDGIPIVLRMFQRELLSRDLVKGSSEVDVGGLEGLAVNVHVVVQRAV